MRRSFGVASVVALLGVGLVGVVSARADMLTFTDRAAWEAAATGFLAEEDFNAFTADTFVPQYPDTLQFPSFTFQRLGFLSGPSHNFFNIGTKVMHSPYGAALAGKLQNFLEDPLRDAFNTEFNFIDSAPFLVPDGDSAKDHNIDGTSYFRGGLVQNDIRFRITFDAGITAWGADFTHVSDGAGLDLLLGNALDSEPVDPNAVLLTGPTMNTGFFGFITTDSFTQLTFQTRGSGGEEFGMDNMVFDPPAPVPEPSTFLLVFLGLLWLGISGWCGRSHHAPCKAARRTAHTTLAQTTATLG